MMRSWLLVPANDAEMLRQALTSAADVLVIDLVTVPLSLKEQARQEAGAFLRERGQRRCFVLAHPHDTGLLDADIGTALGGRADGILLSGVRAAADLQRLDVMLSAREAIMGIAAGSTRIAALSGDNPAGVMSSGEAMATASPRLDALCWSAARLAAAIGAADPDEAGSTARAALLFAAATAGIAAIDTDRETADAETFQAARRQGFAGCLTRALPQLSAINRAFTPDAEEIAMAKQILAAFSSCDGKSAFLADGHPLREADLIRARRILASAGKA